MNKQRNIIGILLGILLLLITISFMTLLKILNIVPNKYYNILIIIISLITVIICILLFMKKKNKTVIILKYIAYFITIILISVYSFGIYYLNKTMNFIENIGILKEEVTNYYIVVLNDARYQESSDLYGQTLIYFENTEKNIIDSLKLNLTYKSMNDIHQIKEELYNKNVESILISDIIKNKLEEDYEDFNTNTRILKTISISSKIEDITKKVTIKNTPFNILISGIDTYGDISTTARNDVNIVATVNPNTNKVLLTSIPRDYYVKLHGTTGYNDKLTHASYYGTNMVVQTIEDILDIDINYYVKVNFSTVVELVDAIGGIEVYADEYMSASGCNFNKGYNKVNGACALAFSRERHSYSDGDLHRGRNQQEVIKAIFNKLSEGTTIISKYNDVLSVLDGKFVTNMNIPDTIDYLKYEMNDLKDYDIESIQLKGSGSMGETYSYSGQDLWIMIPDEETINNAHDLIIKVLNNESIK